MRCDEVRELITIFLEGELDKETSQAVKAHIDSCEKCKSLMEDSFKIIRSLRSIEPLPVPERVIDGILKATTRRRKRFFVLPIFQPQWVFAFSVFVLSFFFFTYPKKALLLDSVEFKTHRTYSQVVRVVSKVEGMVDYVKSVKFKKLPDSSEIKREKLELKNKRKGAEKILISRDLKTFI